LAEAVRWERTPGWWWRRMRERLRLLDRWREEREEARRQLAHLRERVERLTGEVASLAGRRQQMEAERDRWREEAGRYAGEAEAARGVRAVAVDGLVSDLRAWAPQVVGDEIQAAMSHAADAIEGLCALVVSLREQRDFAQTDYAILSDDYKQLAIDLTKAREERDLALAHDRVTGRMSMKLRTGRHDG